MASKVDKLGVSAKLNALMAKEIFGWKNVHRDHKNGKSNEVWAKKPDKLGRWRKTKVPNFSEDIAQMPAMETRLKQLKLFEFYTKELAKIASAKRLPADWTTPDQRCRAALKVVGKRPKR